jgi:hypothetical protein
MNHSGYDWSSINSLSNCSALPVISFMCIHSRLSSARSSAVGHLNFGLREHRLWLQETRIRANKNPIRPTKWAVCGFGLHRANTDNGTFVVVESVLELHFKKNIRLHFIFGRNREY